SSVFGPNPHLSYWNGFGFATNRPGRRQEQGPQSTGGQDPRPLDPGQGFRPERPLEGRPVDHQGQEHQGGGHSTPQGGVAAAPASGFVPAPEAVGFGPGAAVQHVKHLGHHQAGEGGGAGLGQAAGVPQAPEEDRQGGDPDGHAPGDDAPA